MSFSALTPPGSLEPPPPPPQDSLAFMDGPPILIPASHAQPSFSYWYSSPLPSPIPQLPPAILPTVPRPLLPDPTHEFLQILRSFRPPVMNESFPSHTSITAPSQPSTTPPNLEDKNVASSFISELRRVAIQSKEVALKMIELTNIKATSLPLKRPILKSLDGKQEPQVSRGITESASTENMRAEDCPATQTIHNVFVQDSHLKGTISSLFNELLQKCRDENGLFYGQFYDDAPGVVQMRAVSEIWDTAEVTLPYFGMEEKWIEFSLHEESRGSVIDILKPMLPSKYWLLQKELSGWTDLPSSECSLVLLEAASALGSISRMDLKKWLLSSRLVSDSTLLQHILLLVVFCLRAVNREASKIQPDTRILKSWTSQSQVMLDSIQWLSCILARLCDPATSRILVVHLYKRSLEDAAYNCVCVATGDNISKATYGGCSPALLQSTTENDSYFDSDHIGQGFLSLQHIAAAFVAIEKHAIHERTKKAESQFFDASPLQRSVMHSTSVRNAEEVRMLRSNYRPVLEHDGLIWQRPSNQDSKKSKTKEELLAEERDYKRRRMSYRGKKVKRSPVQVLHDIIEAYMSDIVAAGGIGCLSRRPDGQSTGSRDFQGGSNSGFEDAQSLGRDNISKHLSMMDTQEIESKSRHPRSIMHSKSRYDEHGHKSYDDEGSCHHYDRHRSLSSHQDDHQSHRSRNKWKSDY